MPATNPRLTITLEPSLAAILRRISQLTGNSQSSLIGELLGQSRPIFERMVSVLEAASKLKEQGENIPSEIGASLEHAQERMEKQLGLLLDDFDVGSRPILEAVEKVQRRAARPGTRAQRAGAGVAPVRPGPPMSNRGVTTPPTGKKTGKTRTAKGGRHGQV
jgi:hypothetical protein